MSDEEPAIPTRRKRRLIPALPFLTIGMTLGGCVANSIPHVDPSLPRFAGRDPDELTELARGRQEYIAKCSGCHALYSPARGDARYWETWMLRMARRSQIDDQESARILAYLHAWSQRCDETTL